MIPASDAHLKVGPAKRAAKAARANSAVVDTNKQERIKVGGVDDQDDQLGRRRSPATAAQGRRAVLDHRLRDRARRPPRLAHRRHRGDAVHHRRHRRAADGGRASIPVGPGSVFVLPTNVRHDLANTGKETLRAVAFFAAAMFTQDFDSVMLPPKSPHPRHAEPRGLGAASSSFVGDLQDGAASFAVHGVGVVAQ